MTLAPGTRLGAYEIVAPIGQGGMGVVYRARDVTEVIGGAHMSLSRDESLIMDVLSHRALWCSPLDRSGGAPRKVFEFDDPESRIDYPVWSPDGRWIVFDRFQPHGGDVWAVEE